MVKKADIILLAVLLAAAAAIGAFLGVGADRNITRPAVKITVNGQHFGTYSLSQDREVVIGEGNICSIAHGKAEMIYADCPDQICVHTRAIDEKGGNIICLPNRVVVEIVNAGEGGIDGLSE